MATEHAVGSYDLTLLCNTTFAAILLCSYPVFAFLLTHRGDFYHRRRWKAAIWFAGVPTGIGTAVLLFFTIANTLSSMSSMSVFKIVGPVVEAVAAVLSIAVPYLFIVTWGTHHQLKKWLNSDDYLDKLWKDPNRGHKSPIQEL